MMKPLNSNERSKAFYKVIGWFIFCFILAVLLGFATMNEKNVADYTAGKKLEALKNDLMFQEKVFQPNIKDATNKLQDLPNYKQKNLILDDLATSINVSLEKIKNAWKADEKDQQYIMYKNIVDVYFALKSTYVNKFKLEEQLEAKESVVKSGSGDLQRVIDRRDELDRENKTLKTDKDILSSNTEKLLNQVEKLQNQTQKLQSQVVQSRDSLRRCLGELRGYRQNK